MPDSITAGPYFTAWKNSIIRRHDANSFLRAAAGIAFVLLTSWLAFQLHLNLAAAGLLQLLAVLVAALNAGFWQATAVSLVANGCLNYFFIPPAFTFHVTDPQNWVALIVFEVTALIVSRLSTEARQHALAADTRRCELEQLYQVSRQLLLLGREQPLNRQILSLTERVFHIHAGALFDASLPDVELLGDGAASLAAPTRHTYLHNRDSQSPDGRTCFRVLRLGVRPVGAIALQGDRLSSATADALASLIAIAMEHAHSLVRENRAEAERQSEQLRTTVLDALAHEFKTPLTSIRAAASGLLEVGRLTPSQSELLTIIDGETRRLTGLTTRLLQMSRLDTADIRMRPQKIDVGELLSALLSPTLLSGHPLTVLGVEEGACLQADRELVNMALTQFVDNAAKYSMPASTITVAVTTLPAAVRISVHNLGPVIPPEDQERIFERFYRGAGSNHKAPGTGIGLSISKKVADAHGGRVWLTSHIHRGTTFFLELPRCKTTLLPMPPQTLRLNAHQPNS